MEKKLNELLADLVIETHKLQSLHWYVKGNDFFEAHPQLDVFYEQVGSLVDEVAETMLMCDMKPISSVKEFLDASGIKEHEGEFKSSKETYAEIAKDFESILELVKEIRTLAEKDGNDLITIKTDPMVEQFSKDIWMLKQR